MNFNDMPENIIISSQKKQYTNKINEYLQKNNLEESKMKFSEREGKINLELLNGVDFKILFDKDNQILFKKILDNFVTSKFYRSDFDDNYKYLLFISFQNSLDYLITKKNNLMRANKYMNAKISMINRQTNKLEKKLENNKIIIEENSKKLEENKLSYDKIKKEYEEVKNKKTIIELKNSKKDSEKKINNILINENNIILNENNKNNTNSNTNSDRKYFCDICYNKFFFNVESLEEHQIKRHPFLIIKKSQKIDNENIYKYSEKLESLRKEISNTYNNFLIKEKQNESNIKDLIQKKENYFYISTYLENQEIITDEMKETFENIAERQDIFINELKSLFNSTKIRKTRKENKFKKNESQKRSEKSINIILDNLDIDKNIKTKYIKPEINIHDLSKDIQKNIEFKEELKYQKNNNLNIISQIINNDIKEDKKENMNNDNRTEKMIKIKKEIEIKSLLQDENKSIIKKNKGITATEDEEKRKEDEKIKEKEKDRSDEKSETRKNEKKNKNDEEEENKEEKEKFTNDEEKKLKGDDKDYKKEQINKDENEIREDKIEEEEDEDEEKELSILSNYKENTPIDIVRIRNIQNEQNECHKEKEISIFINNLFEKNQVNFNNNIKLTDDINPFYFDKNVKNQNLINLKNKGKNISLFIDI